MYYVVLRFVMCVVSAFFRVFVYYSFFFCVSCRMFCAVGYQIAQRLPNTLPCRQIPTVSIKSDGRFCINYFTSLANHDLDRPVPHLPLWEIVQDLRSTDPTQETRVLDYVDFTGPAQQATWPIDGRSDQTRSGGDLCLETFRSWSENRSSIYRSRSIRGVQVVLI